MVKNRYKQDAPGQKTIGELGDVIVEGMVMPGGASRDAPGYAGRKESLQMIVHEEDIEVFSTGLLPQGDKPGESHSDKNQHAEPQAHSKNFFEVSFYDEKCKDAEPRYNNTDEPFRVEG